MNQIKKILSAIAVLVVSCFIAGGSSVVLYNAFIAMGNDSTSANQFTIPLFGILLALCLYIGFRVSKRINRD